MRIALLTDGLWPLQVGGMEKHSWYLAKQLAESGHKVDIFFSSALNQTAKPVFDSNLGIVEHPLSPVKKGRLPGHYLKESRSFSLKIYSALADELLKFDLIYIQGFAGWELLRRKAKGEKTPLTLLNFHGLEMFKHIPGIKSRIAAMLLRKAAIENLHATDFAIALGKGLSEILIANKIPEEKILQISIGIERDWLVEPLFNIKEKQALRFLFVGRAEKRKGIEILNKAILNFGAQLPFFFDFVGPVAHKNKIDHSKIRYHGLVREEEKLKQIFKECDVFVLPSYAEGMPTVILEAMASGLAIIATEVGAVSDLINGNGFLIQPGSPTQLIEAMKKMMALSPVELEAMKKKSCEWVAENYVWETVTESTIEIFENCIKRQKGFPLS